MVTRKKRDIATGTFQSGQLCRDGSEIGVRRVVSPSELSVFKHRSNRGRKWAAPDNCSVVECPRRTPIQRHDDREADLHRRALGCARLSGPGCLRADLSSDFPPEFGWIAG